ncbi:hypothetical protein MLD38_021533 [Melastoma candidum]|uniref:Uncharacterized protein n=1 Tax=Melastoma candidum TaxID=119954 RepID=A0ACB9QGV9_9MYRT|nr:hypothetical protein MLD38_021533 [Melastoma candidum]
MRRSIVISLFLCFSLLVVGSTSDPVETTCSKTGNHDLCLSTLRADPRSSSADVKGLAEIALDAASAKSNEALNYFLDLLRGEGDPVRSRFYGTCIDTYGGNVKRIIPEALTDLTNNQFASAKESITTAATNAQWCEDQFAGSSPGTGQNKAAHDTAALAADVIGTLG